MTLALRFARLPCNYEARLHVFKCGRALHVSAVRSTSSQNSVPPTSSTPPPPPSQKQPPTKQKLSREVVRQNVQGYVFTRYIDIVKNYDKVLEKNFPSAVKVYRVFFDGVKDFYADMKRYLKISRIANASPVGLRSLNRKELELYMQMPRDMVKVAPALIGSSLPMVGYAIFPLVLMYPRRFLTAHFWSLQQKSDFQELTLLERLQQNRPVFRCLQAKLKSVKHHDLHTSLNSLFGLIGSGFHPTVEALLDIKDIFAQPPYSLLSLSGKHVKLLSQMHGLSGSWFKRHRLAEHAYIIHHMDLAIKREGGVHNMHVDAIRKACFIRGLNPSNLSSEEMIEWLRSWIRISTSIKEEHISLFLHLPLFLAYNHPNNWQLVYGNTGKSNTPNSNSNKNLPNAPLIVSAPLDQQLPLEELGTKPTTSQSTNNAAEVELTASATTPQVPTVEPRKQQQQQQQQQ